MIVCQRILKGRQRPLERCLLSSDQPARRSPDTNQERDLQQELDANVPDVVDGKIQPAIQLAPPGFGDLVDHTVGSGNALLGVDGLGETGLHQSVEGSIDEGSSHGEDATHLTIGTQLF